MRSHKASQHIDYNLLDLLHFFFIHFEKPRPVCITFEVVCLFKNLNSFETKTASSFFFYNTPLSENEDSSVDKQQAYEIKKFRLLRPKPSRCTIHTQMKGHDKKKKQIFLLLP